MPFGKILKNIVPAAIGYATGGPVGATLAFAESDRAQTRAKQQRQKNEQFQREQQKIRENAMAIDYSDFASTAPRVQTTSTQQSGFSSFLGGLSRDYIRPAFDFLGEAGALFRGPTRPQNVQQQPAVTTITNLGARETQGSGTNEAFIGGFGNVLGQASRFLRSPTGSVATGLGGAIAGSMFGDEPRSMRVTRKTKRLAQQAYSLAMGDLSGATQLFQQLSGISVGEREFVLILTKRFRNDGAVVTRAALRKTKTTIRRLKGMCDMYDSLRPTATRRRAPMKRATTTLIKN